MKTRALLIAAVLALAACGADEPAATAPEPAGDATPGIDGGVFVHLFEWHWPDVAAECENVLGPAGYAGVQVSPPNEHITGPAWWTRYQPVSYKIESRSGNREQFADMVRRCKAAGVDIYVDAIINHMAGFPSGVGVAGSEYSEYDYPVPYTYDDFHHCGRNENDRIESYQDLFEVQNCQLGTLDDLDTGNPSVQEKLAAYLNDLLSLGVAGFRIDAAKHIWHEELAEILARVEGEPFVFQEVIDAGNEPIRAMDYVDTGHVTEFKYPPVLVEAFENGNLDALTDFWRLPGWLPSDKAIVFVDNHDNQRGHGPGGHILNYKDGARYDLAVAFMLAHPYGYPKVMSSYAFEDAQQGPPQSSPLDQADGCGNAWICEHRHNAIASMVAFRKATHGSDIVNWQVVDNSVISLGRGDTGHVIINTDDDPANVEVTAALPEGEYIDLISRDARATVDENGVLSVTVAPKTVIALLDAKAD